MSEEFLELMLEREPELAEILDYFILVPEEIFYDRYCCNVKSCISYNLLYDLITNERYYSYVYALFYEFAVPGDNLCVGFVDENRELVSIDISRSTIAKSILYYQAEGRLNFSGVYAERINDILEKTSLKSLIKTVKGETFRRIVDSEDVTVSCDNLLDFLHWSKEDFEEFFEDLDSPVYGISKYHFAYLMGEFVFANAIFDDYVLTEEMVVRINLLANPQVIDIEAINEIRKTYDPTLPYTTINPELKSAVLDNMRPDLTDLEKAIYVYIKLCKILTYDDEFYAVNQKGIVALRHENPELASRITPTNNKVVCYEFNSLYAKFLDEFKIKLTTSSISNGMYKGHTNLKFRTGKFLVLADSLKSILKCDLVNAKLNKALTGIVCLNQNTKTREEFNEIVNRVYEMIAQEENVALVEEDETFEEILRQYEEMSPSSLDFDKKLEIMMRKVIDSGMQGVDSIAYVLQLRRIFFNQHEREHNIRASVVRDNLNVKKDRVATVSVIFTVNRTDYAKDIFANHYYLFHPDYPLTVLSLELIDEMFREGVLEYIGNKYLKVPGVKKRDDVNAKEAENFKQNFNK